MKIISIKGTGVSLTPSIVDTIEKKFLPLSKFTERLEPMAELRVEVAKTSRHHKKGDVWRAEANLTLPHRMIRAEEMDEGLYAAIDKVREELARQIKHYTEKTRTRRVVGARRAKKFTALSSGAMKPHDAQIAERLRGDDEDDGV